MSEPKELHFFIDEASFAPGPFMTGPEDSAVLRGPANWSKGIDWYAQHFDPNTPVRGESTVAYGFPWYVGTAERMANVIPDTRLIFVVRNPLERIVSHYLAYAQAGRERRPLPAALAAPNSWYVAASRYSSILRGYLAWFDRSQLLVISQRDLLTNRADCLRHIFEFLGVDESFSAPEMQIMRNRFVAKGRVYRLAERVKRSPRTGPMVDRIPTSLRVRAERALSSRRSTPGHPQLSAELQRQLIEELEPEIADLETLTGWDLSEWREENGASVSTPEAPR